MYAAFRENNESLPGDEEILKKPSVKIYLYPLPSDPVDQALPKLASCQLIVQKNMTIDALKKYLLKRMNVLSVNLNLQPSYHLKYFPLNSYHRNTISF